MEARDAMHFRKAIYNTLGMGSRGRYMVVSGIQANATLEDIVRFFEGYSLLGNAVTIIKEASRCSR
jgi:hypothetical protein